MANRAEIEAEFKRYNPEHQMTEQDVQNVQTHGLGIVGKSFDKMGAGREDQMSAQQQGQAAGSTPLTPSAAAEEQATTAVEEAPSMMSDMSAKDQLEQMTGTQTIYEGMLKKGLEAKAKEAQPFEEAIAKKKEKLGQLDIQDYFAMGPERALEAMANDANRIRTRIDYLGQEKLDREGSLLEIQESAKGMYGDKMSSLQLQMQTEQEAKAFAFSAPILLSGAMPPNLPPNLQENWRAASAEARRQQAVAEAAGGGGGGGGGGSPVSLQYKNTEGGPMLFNKETGQSAYTWELNNLRRDVNQSGGYDFFGVDPETGEDTSMSPEMFASYANLPVSEVIAGSGDPGDISRLKEQPTQTINITNPDG